MRCFLFSFTLLLASVVLLNHHNVVVGVEEKEVSESQSDSVSDVDSGKRKYPFDDHDGEHAKIHGAPNQHEDGVDGEVEGSWRKTHGKKYGSFGKRVRQQDVWDGSHDQAQISDRDRMLHRRRHSRAKRRNGQGSEERRQRELESKRSHNARWKDEHRRRGEKLKEPRS